MFGEKITIKCENCNELFLFSKATAKKRNVRFCGMACTAESRKKQSIQRRTIQVCGQCGKDFTAPRNRPQTFCSLKCLGVYRTDRARPENNPLESRPCRYCGLIFETRKPTKLYCSLQCQRDIRKGSRHATRACEDCGISFQPRNAGARFCSRRCLYNSQSGEKSNGWKGGVTRDADGYVRIYQKDHPNAKGGYVKEHRYVMEKMIGRYLKPNENVHHINGKRDDNRPENLELWVSSQPPGQRAADLVKYARDIIFWYGNLFPEVSKD